MISPTFVQRHLLRRSWLGRSLYPVSLLYGKVLNLRRNVFSPRAFHAPCAVISVGNICSGGTGKTPFTIALAREMRSRGWNPGISHRGYKGTFESTPTIISRGDGPVYDASICGDEAYMLAASLPGIPVVAGANRTASIKLLMAECKDLDLIILDDGFQHLKVRRDLDIVCFGAESGIGNGWVIPSGYLREPLNALKPWQMLVINHKHPQKQDNGLEAILKGFSRDLHRCEFQVSGWKDSEGRAIEPDPSASYTLVSGIADPVSFEKLVRSTGMKIVNHYAFPDHYPFRDRSQIQSILDRCRNQKGEKLICTAKDMVKLKDIPELRDMIIAMDIQLTPRAQDPLWKAIADRIKYARISG